MHHTPVSLPSLSVTTLIVALGCGTTQRSEADTDPVSTGADPNAVGGTSTTVPNAPSDPPATGQDGPADPVSGPGVLFIQEDELGFSAVDGSIFPRQGSTSVTGFTGSGFADGDAGLGKAMSWSVNAATAGTFTLVWRYAFGGTETNLRDAQLRINGNVASELVVFPYTTAWDQWSETTALQVAFEAGPNFLQLVAVQPSGLANIDYLQVLGEGVAPDDPRFSLAVVANDDARGSVSVQPLKDFYEAGEAITLSAAASDGYFFQSWSGTVSSIELNYTFDIEENTQVEALFLPEGTVAVPDVIGYATVQDDDGTPFLMTGGSLGEAVTATSFEELKGLLESEPPLVVSFAGLFEAVDDIQIASNKTLLGIGDSAHLMGIELEVNGSRNVIIRNVAVSHVVAEGSGVANDAIVITGGARNVWIDHCELFSDLLNGEDFYDGLVEIKNQARFITVSHTEFHDHFKASLISSGDDQLADTAIRVTFHHNYFHDCSSRMPSIRFGQAHVFNNYYLDNLLGSSVNSRQGAVVRVEGNYFQNTKDPITSRDSPLVGLWDVNDNTFDNCTGSQPTTSTGSLTPPYPYVLDATSEVPALIEQTAGVGRL